MTACYDRHIREISNLVLQLHRVNKNSAETLIKALGEMKTHVVTGFGVSKDSYRSTEEEIQYRTGQGNVVSVFVCQFGTSIIFYLLEEEFKGWHVLDEQGRVVGVKLAIGFVNDTDFFVRREKDAIELVGRIYRKYIKLYQATGGKISLKKACFIIGGRAWLKGN